MYVGHCRAADCPESQLASMAQIGDGHYLTQRIHD
jgi:hypothetical protein